ncbi:MAG: hypothetical protein J6J24_04760 [Clostridia bacterium]|nr:hypothetical protein [Clostridia bacterium]
MKRKILLSIFAFCFIIPAMFCLGACSKDKDPTLPQEPETPPQAPQIETYTVQYDLNFADTDYLALQKIVSGGLTFDVEGFELEKQTIEQGNVEIIYSKEIEKNAGFILYRFSDDILRQFFDGWYTGSGVRVDEFQSVKNDITLYAKWNTELASKFQQTGSEFEYQFNEVNRTAAFANGKAGMTHNSIGIVYLPELVVHQGKIYVVNDIVYNGSREPMVIYVPKTYNGTLSEWIVFPNKDIENDVSYLGNNIAIGSTAGHGILIYEANYNNNTAKLKYIHTFNLNYYKARYLTLGGEISFTKEDGTDVTLKIVDSWGITVNRCGYTKFIIKDTLEEYPSFWNVYDSIEVFFEETKETVAEKDSNEEILSRGDIKVYYYAETQPASDAGSYWHYDTDGKTPVIWQ